MGGLINIEPASQVGANNNMTREARLEVRNDTDPVKSEDVGCLQNFRRGLKSYYLWLGSKTGPAVEGSRVAAGKTAAAAGAAAAV